MVARHRSVAEIIKLWEIHPRETSHDDVMFSQLISGLIHEKLVDEDEIARKTSWNKDTVRRWKEQRGLPPPNIRSNIFKWAESLLPR